MAMRILTALLKKDGAYAGKLLIRKITQTQSWLRIGKFPGVKTKRPTQLDYCKSLVAGRINCAIAKLRQFYNNERPHSSRGIGRFPRWARYDGKFRVLEPEDGLTNLLKISIFRERLCRTLADLGNAKKIIGRASFIAEARVQEFPELALKRLQDSADILI